MQVKKRDGSVEKFDENKILKCLEFACKDLLDVNPKELLESIKYQAYSGITTLEIDKMSILVARSKIEEEPNYTYVAARLMLRTIRKEVFGEKHTSDEYYKGRFVKHMEKLHKLGFVSDAMMELDLNKLQATIDVNRDLKLKYLGLQTLYDRYFIQKDKQRLEVPQFFWMRVAMGLSLNEKDKTEWAIKFYNQISQLNYLPSTPTLFNSGTKHSQLASCYLSIFDDSIDGIFGGIHEQARLSKYAGGLGMSITSLRASNSYIAGTNGESSGLIPWVKIINDTLIAVNQSGKRRGSGCVYLEPWHLDFEDFLDLKKNTGDDRRRAHDTHTASWIPDEFMNRVEKDDVWYLFDPGEFPMLHNTFGKDFEKLYQSCIEKAEAGKVKNFRKMSAKDLWKKMLKGIFETGGPWKTFKDACNIRYNLQDVGIVHSSNLCTEIMRHTFPSKYEDSIKTEIGETGVCTLASLNVASFFENGKIDYIKLAEAIRSAIRGLDNSIDINFYPSPEARNSHMKNRPIGLGIMGWHDLLYLMNILFDSDEAKQLADDLQEYISYIAFDESSNLAKEKGKYENYSRSETAKNILPIDSYEKLMKHRKTNVETKKNVYIEKLDWDKLREKIKKTGLRNADLMAIAPTATISYICGCSQSNEANYSIIYVYSTLSGDFTMTNPYFVKDCKELGLWSKGLLDNIKNNDGDISNLALPKKLKDKYKTAFQWDQEKVIKIAASRQKWIDQGQSLNLFVAEPSMKLLNNYYFAAFKSGLKSTYYLRTKAVSSIEKSTVEKVEKPKVCPIDGSCESCQ